MAAKPRNDSDRLLEQAVSYARSCYQCGRCSGGCPMTNAMDHSPRALLRLLQLGAVDDALRSNTPWLCAGCHGCSICCPRGVDLPQVMYLLRQWMAADGASNESVRFYREFVTCIQRRGTVYEPELLLTYARRVGPGALIPHFRMGIGLALGGKLSFGPRSIAGKEGLRQTIRAAMKG